MPRLPRHARVSWTGTTARGGGGAGLARCRYRASGAGVPEGTCPQGGWGGRRVNRGMDSPNASRPGRPPAPIPTCFPAPGGFLHTTAPRKGGGQGVTPSTASPDDARTSFLHVRGLRSLRDRRGRSSPPLTPIVGWVMSGDPCAIHRHGRRIGGVGGSASPGRDPHPVRSKGIGRLGLARRRLREPAPGGSPEGKCPHEGTGAVRPGAAAVRGTLPRRAQAECALQDPKDSRASAGAVLARPAGGAHRSGPRVRVDAGEPARLPRSGRGQAPGQSRDGLLERFAVGAGFAATAPDLHPGAAGPGVDAPPPREPVRPTAPAPPSGAPMPGCARRTGCPSSGPPHHARALEH